MGSKIVKVAVFLSEEYGGESVCDEGFESVSGYVRITEFIEVNFIPRPQEDIVKERIVTIDEQIEQVQAISEIKINELKDKRQKLLALPQPLKED